MDTWNGLMKILLEHTMAYVSSPETTDKIAFEKAIDEYWMLMIKDAEQQARDQNMLHNEASNIIINMPIKLHWIQSGLFSNEEHLISDIHRYPILTPDLFYLLSEYWMPVESAVKEVSVYYN